ncbi:MAG TPA: fibrobacter succinogenes major paralogous domain-containing protein [Tenuifilaceae bacterium]|nr:fibrobacter succinogenes major paralogous domain-containing protein [Tenuifilaceae bacterium]
MNCKHCKAEWTPPANGSLTSCPFCHKPLNEVSEVGELYPSVKINNLVWMAENLNLSHFRNGEPIPEIQSNEEWLQASEQGKPAWCYYDNDPENGKKYGKLYNCFAVNDPRSLAPEGWHVGSDKEWNELTFFIGSPWVVGRNLKSKTGWDYDGNGIDDFGFGGLPGGYRLPSGEFNFVRCEGRWWSSTKLWHRVMYVEDDEIFRHNNHPGYGFSVRCLRDIG